MIADIWENLVFSGPWGKVYYAFQHLVKTQIYSSLDLLLSLLIQCTTCPFEQAQNWKFNKLKFKMEKFRILEVGKLYFHSSPVQEAGKIGLKVLQIHETLNVPDMKFLITKFKTHQTFFLNLNAKY